MDNIEDIETNAAGGSQSKLGKTYVGIPIEGIRAYCPGNKASVSCENLIKALHYASEEYRLTGARSATMDYTRLVFTSCCKYYMLINCLEVKTEILGIPSPVWNSLAKTRYYANEKYGEDNWKSIDFRSHLDHGIAHIHKFLEGDTSDNHLDNLLCRVFLALGVLQIELEGQNNDS